MHLCLVCPGAGEVDYFFDGFVHVDPAAQCVRELAAIMRAAVTERGVPYEQPCVGIHREADLCDEGALVALQRDRYRIGIDLVPCVELPRDRCLRRPSATIGTDAPCTGGNTSSFGADQRCARQIDAEARLGTVQRPGERLSIETDVDHFCSCLHHCLVREEVRTDFER